MSQVPPQALNYMRAPQPPPAAHSPGSGRKLFGWVLFIGLAIMLFMLLSKRQTTAASISLDQFAQQLETKQIAWLSIDGDEVRGALTTPLNLPNGQRVVEFRTALPTGMGSDWGFVHWVLDRAKDTTTVQVHRANDYIVNILVPLIPWLLILGFIWFFVFRNLRKAAKSNQVVITGPGRWVPDEAGKAGQP